MALISTHSIMSDFYISSFLMTDIIFQIKENIIQGRAMRWHEEEIQLWSLTQKGSRFLHFSKFLKRFEFSFILGGFAFQQGHL